MSLLGPLDKRLQVRRCKACQRRKIRCSKETPCAYCVKIGQPCERVSDERLHSANQGVVFKLPQTGPFKSTESNRIAKKSLSTEISIRQLDPWNERSDVLVAHFFSNFLAFNDFTGRSWKVLDGHLYELSNKSPELQNATIALAALDSGRMSSSRAFPEGHMDLKNIALRSYSSSIQGLKLQLSRISSNRDWESVLWTTFFLGVFELMLEPSDTNWGMHFQHGTSSLLQLLGPQWCMNGFGRDCFITLRIFEISKALLYNETTFLAESAWVDVIKTSRDPSSKGFNLKEFLYDLMVSCSSLFIRVGRYIEADITRDDSEGIDLAAQGCQLRDQLAEWQQEAYIQSQSLDKFEKSQSSELLLSLIYFHTISIYLSGIYDYYPEMFPSRALLPTLSQSQIDYHLASLLELTASALNTNLAGLLFFFPLRVAAARSKSTQYRNEVLSLLRSVKSKGFAISDYMQSEVRGLWIARDKMATIKPPSQT